MVTKHLFAGGNGPDATRAHNSDWLFAARPWDIVPQLVQWDILRAWDMPGSIIGVRSNVNDARLLAGGKSLV
jgi:hypothetical protein